MFPIIFLSSMLSKSICVQHRNTMEHSLCMDFLALIPTGNGVRDVERHTTKVTNTLSVAQATARKSIPHKNSRGTQIPPVKGFFMSNPIQSIPIFSYSSSFCPVV